MVINHNEILWQILRDGIKIGGKEYMLFTATTGQVRNVTVTLMRKDFFEKHKGFLMVGLTTESINAIQIEMDENKISINLDIEEEDNSEILFTVQDIYNPMIYLQAYNVNLIRI